MAISPMTILIGLVPVLGIGAGYLFLDPIKKMFSNIGKEKKHNKAITEGENKIKALSSKSSEVVVKIKNLEAAATITKEKIADEIEASQKRVDAIVKSDKNLTDLSIEFDKEW